MLDTQSRAVVAQLVAGGTCKDVRFGWLSVAVDYRMAAREGRATDVRRAVSDFEASLLASGPGAELLADTAAALASPSGLPDAGLLSLLAVLLSSFQGAHEASTRAAREAAVRLCRAALEAAPVTGSAPIAVRLARLCEELDDTAGALDAWGEALLRDPLLAWALPDDLRSDPAFVAMEKRALQASSGVERDLRRALLMLASAHERDDGRSLLQSIIAAPSAPPGSALVLAAELVGDAARQAPRSSDAERALTAARALLDPVGHNPAAGLLRALIAILTPDRDAAVHSVLVDLTALGGGRPDDADASGIVDALTELIRRPPYDPRPILRTAYFDAMFDPAAAIRIPRGPLAIYRRHLLGLALVSMMGSLGCAPVIAGGQHGLTATWSFDFPSATPHETPSDTRPAPAAARRLVRFIIIMPPGYEPPELVQAFVAGHSREPSMDTTMPLRIEYPNDAGGNQSTWQWSPEQHLTGAQRIDLVLAKGGATFAKTEVAPFGGELGGSDVVLRLAEREIPAEWPRALAPVVSETMGDSGADRQEIATKVDPAR